MDSKSHAASTARPSPDASATHRAYLELRRMIVAGEIPSYKVAENDDYFAFLDISPNSKGHTLVVPKKEENKIFDLNEDEYLKLMRFSYKVAKAIERAVSHPNDVKGHP